MVGVTAEGPGDPDLHAGAAEYEIDVDPADLAAVVC
jgi:hypothetical protein